MWCFGHFTRAEERKERRVPPFEEIAFPMSVFERHSNWVSKLLKRSNLVSCFQISPTAREEMFSDHRKGLALMNRERSGRT
jgi:hypothetical protein